MKLALIFLALFAGSCAFGLALAYILGGIDKQDQEARERWAKEHQRPW